MTFVSELMVLPVAARTPRAAFAAETGWMSHRLADFERSRANAGVTVERVSLLSTSHGTVTISYLEGSASYRDVARTIRHSPSVFDQDMMTRGQVLHGLSSGQQKERRKPLTTEVLFREVDGKRQPWHAFCAAIEAQERWTELCTALDGPRHAEFEEFNRANGFSVFCAGRYDDGEGGLACFYLEGTDDTGALPLAVADGGSFADWFAAAFEATFGVDVRQGLPFPAMGKPWDWVQGEPNEVVAPLFARATQLLGE